MSNLIPQQPLARLADLPPEIPAEPIYEQIKAIRDKCRELETTYENLKSQQSYVSLGQIDQDQLKFRIRRAVKNLEMAPVEERRPIFENLIKFAEVFPKKLKLGVYAPTTRGGSCTVTNGAGERT